MGNEVIQLGGNAVAVLRSVIDRITRLESDKADIAADIRDVYTEAKGNGFDAKALRVIVRQKLKDSREDEMELQAIVDLYWERAFEDALRSEVKAAEDESEMLEDLG